METSFSRTRLGNSVHTDGIHVYVLSVMSVIFFYFSVLGELTPARLNILREADDIMIQELHAANVYNNIGQAFVVLLPVKSVGVMGDCRTYEEACAIRCVTTSDFMTADWYHMDYVLLGKIANRIVNEVRGINRVCYDVSSKPPATIEWE